MVGLKIVQEYGLPTEGFHFLMDNILITSRICNNDLAAVSRCRSAGRGEMGIFEGSFIFKAVSKQAIKADMSDPNEGTKHEDF